ncbi:MAG: DUF3102 domain-containing protein [Xanthobacteraceae bacterium]
MQEPSNVSRLQPQGQLASLAERICTEHQAVVGAVRTGLEHAMAAGDLLIMAKQEIGHGPFGEWVERNCKMSYRTARSYMQLANNRNEIESNWQSSANLNLSVAGALRLISGPSKPKARSAAAQPRPGKVPAQFSGTGFNRSDSKAVALMWTIWDRMPVSDRRRFFETVGLSAILEHIPEAWARTVEEKVRPSDWKPWAEMPADWRADDNLEVPALLRREPERAH